MNSDQRKQNFYKDQLLTVQVDILPMLTPIPGILTPLNEG